eukprot:6197546-Pleurochrysis_carterae.AAC.2
MNRVMCGQGRASVPAATPKQKLSMPYKVMLNALRCAKLPVTLRTARQLICRCPELVPKRAATSPGSRTSSALSE